MSIKSTGVGKKKIAVLPINVTGVSVPSLPSAEKIESIPLPSVTVLTEPKFSGEHSEPSRGRFVFLYNITINVAGKLGAQLLHRHWIITSADGDVQEVRGEGVIGEQPLILPKQPYQYESYCILPTPLGWIEGDYQMVDDEGRYFSVAVPRFRLAVPGVMQ